VIRGLEHIGSDERTSYWLIGLVIYSTWYSITDLALDVQMTIEIMSWQIH